MSKIFILILLVYELYHWLKAKKLLETAELSETWPTTTGVISYSSILRKKRKGDSPHTVSGDGSGESTGEPEEYRYVQLPQVEYTYEVGGKSYTSQKISLLDSFTVADKESETPDGPGMFPTGSHVTVHYDPLDPETAILAPADTRGLEEELRNRRNGMILLIVLFVLSFAIPI